MIETNINVDFISTDCEKILREKNFKGKDVIFFD